jgi:hypothetical protein
VRAIVGVAERGISERDIVLLANIVLECEWYNGTESIRHRSRLVDHKVEVNPKVANWNIPVASRGI